MGERLKDKVFVANEEAEGDGDGALGGRVCRYSGRAVGVIWGERVMVFNKVFGSQAAACCSQRRSR